MVSSTENKVKALLTLAVLANIATWFYAHDIKSVWGNVPPVPSVLGASAFTMGDKQLAYRTTGIMLQNLGETGGRSTSFAQYNFEELAKWFFLTNELDSKSSFTPFLAAFYFGASPDGSKLGPLLDYLHVVGQRPGGKNWRWLVQATWLARYSMNDLDGALKHAKALSALDNKDMPTWARQMAAFIQNAKGNKEEAIGMLLAILEEGGDDLHPNEINHTREYICMSILDEEEAEAHPICQNLPEGAARRSK